MSENLVLKNYMLLIIFLGTISYVYKTVFGKFLIKRPKYIVKLVEEKTKDIYEITLSPLSQKIAFLPGQFAYFTVNQNFLSHESHPFSIASEPKENNLKILVKREGDYTSTLNKLQIGSRVNVEGPYGKFSYLLGKTKNQIWVAGGIGITPFLSMLPAILNKDYKIDLYYCVHDKNEFVYLSELSRIDQDFENFRFFPVITAQTGRLSSQKIKETSGNLLNKEIYICGPPEMIKSLTKQLLEEGINPAQIKSELFKMK